MVAPLYKSYTGLEAQPITGRVDWVDWVTWAPTTDCDGRRLGLRHIFSVTDRQKRDYLSRASQRARGATKNESLNVV